MLDIIIGIVVAIFLAAAIFMEFKNRNKKGDLFTDIVISVIGLGCSIYMLYNIFILSNDENGQFSLSIFLSEISTWIYIIVILLSIAFTVIYLMFYFKNKDLPDPVEDEEETSDDESLSDEEIEDILENENNDNSVDETSEEENVTEEENDEVDHIVLESLTAQKPKVLKPDEEEFKFKEGASQVPVNQRNPFEKK